MTQHKSPFVLLCLVLFFMLAFSTVFPAYAQTPQIAQTLDGQISIQLPQGWVARDAAEPNFTSILAFGDTPQSLQLVINSLTAPSTQVVAGMNGLIAIINPQLIGGLPGDQAVSALLNSMIATVQQSGGTILDQQSFMLGGQYPASIALVSVPSQQAKGYVGAFQAGSNVVQFQIGASPESAFDANQQTFNAIVDSIRVPAETPNNVIAKPTAVPLGQSDIAPGQSADGAFSFTLPQGWAQQPLTLPNFGETYAFGSSAAALQGIIGLFANGNQAATVNGVGGFVGAVDPAQIQGQKLDDLVSPIMQGILSSVQGSGVTILQQPAQHLFGGQYSGLLTLTNLGYIAVLHSDSVLLVSVIVSSDVNTDQNVLTGILESIRIGGATTVSPVPVQKPTAAPAPNTGAAQTIRSADGRILLSLPGNWVVMDHSADADILAYGDTSAAAQSRLFAAKPDLTTSAPISGNGGLIILYPMSQFGIDPANPDLSSLMQRALGGLAGYTIEQPVQPLQGMGGGLVAVISGAERGYLALIPFGDMIAYVTATGTPDSFPANQSALLTILQSIRVPAAPEGSGLGGLGGLGAEATAEPTAAGIGGLS
jgi:hypothetical protein